MNQIFLDTETIDVTSNTDYDILAQLAYIIPNTKEVYNTYAKPNNYLDNTVGAQESNNLTTEFLEQQPIITNTLAYNRLKELTKDTNYFFAHNASFDLEVIKRTGINIDNFKIIDTMKLCRFINDKLELPWDSVRLTYLKYKLKLYKDREVLAKALNIDLSVITSHNALSDCIDLILLWNYLSKNYSISLEQAVELCKQDLVLTFVPNGKNKGVRFVDLDYNTLKWNYENAYDSDVKYTCKKILGI